MTYDPLNPPPTVTIKYIRDVLRKKRDYVGKIPKRRPSNINVYIVFLATLVALDFTLVSKSVGRS